nr:helix-turn-helix domain-containing protein [uncultured Rhodopila sp.]
MASHQFSTFTDPNEYRERLRGADEQIMILAPGDYRAELTHLDFGTVLVQRSRQSLPHVAIGGAHPQLTSIVLLSRAEQPEVRINGIGAGGRDLLVLGAGSEYYQRAAGDLCWGSTTMPTVTLMASAGILLGREIAPPPVTRLVTPSPGAMERMRSLHESSAIMAASAPEGLHPRVATALQNALIEAMVLCLAPAVHNDTSIALDSRSAGVMRRFMELVEAEPALPLSMIDVCAELGVSGRTLRQYCLRHLGLGPNRYLWLRRMNLARRALSPGGGGITVTQVANDFGFGELGRFAVRYRQLFGETPSATLRRAGGACRAGSPLTSRCPA